MKDNAVPSVFNFGGHHRKVDRTMSEYSENVILYIGGFVVRQLSKKINCDQCEEALYGTQDTIV